jgi:hypothetical protein
MQSGYKEDFDWEEVVESEESRIGAPACQDMSLVAEELNWAESSELEVAEYWKERN